MYRGDLGVLLAVDVGLGMICRRDRSATVSASLYSSRPTSTSCVCNHSTSICQVGHATCCSRQSGWHRCSHSSTSMLTITDLAVAVKPLDFLLISEART